MSTVICHTADCENNGIPLEMTLGGVDPDTGDAWSVSSVTCGPCGEPITDITPPLDTPDAPAP